ncbi:hypothetical protein [Oceanobacillus oncorhynchi]|uniref:hypothetical protein n=1 Tax=Oceanobacillus oncorhynchi TaxID=545501 RepID=UPI0025A35E01|nr:hypothetical protein [Oceanobacillus oncorhynchi]MDM8098684.1 hypothetical protein [Oceanobacillus oncorhynchi]
MGAVKFNASSKHIPMLPLNGKNEFIFDEEEFAFLPGQLTRIAESWNNGMEIPEIAKQEKRTNKNIFLALIDLAYREKITRPLAFIPSERSKISNERYLV